MKHTTTRLFWAVCLAGFYFGCYRETGIEEFPVTVTQVTPENAATVNIGRDASGRIVDYLLQNTNMQVVVNGQIGDPNRALFLPKSSGAIVDLSTQFRSSSNQQLVNRNDDGFNLVSQGVNMNRHTLIDYERIRIQQNSETNASLVLSGSVFDLDGSLETAGASVDPTTRRVADCTVTTTYNLEVNTETQDQNSQSQAAQFLTMTTVIANLGQRALPIFTVNDIALTTPQVFNTFIPYPDWGFDRGEAHAFPQFVLLQPRQSNTAHYAFMSRMDQVLRVDRQIAPEESADVLLVGKATAPNSLAPGEQLTYMRELLPINRGSNLASGIASLSAFSTVVTLLKENISGDNPFAVTGGLDVQPLISNVPGGRIVIDYIKDTRYFDGIAFVPLEEGRRLPIFGDMPVDLSYFFSTGAGDDQTFLLPTGQIEIAMQALNSDPVVITRRINITTNEDGEEVTEEVPLIIPDADTFGLGPVPFASPHAEVSLVLTDENQRLLMGRGMVERVSGQGAVEVGQFPVNLQGRVFYINNVETVAANLPVGDYEIVVSRGPLHEATTLILTVPEDTAPPSAAQNIIVGEFPVTLPTSISLEGFLSADFDVRSSGDPLGFIAQDQLIRFAYAEDLDVLFMADTHHQSIFRDQFDTLAILFGGFDTNDMNNNVDSLIDELKLSRAIATVGKVTGEHGDRGRFAILNLPDENTEAYLELPAFETEPAGFYDRIRRRAPEALIHVTRPRAPKGLETGFFTAVAELMDLPPETPIPADNDFYRATAASGSSTRWIDFDLLQLLSGNRYREFLLARADWFNLLDAGIYRPVTGGSFPGQTRDLPIGAVRTFVAVSDTTLRENNLSEFWSAVGAGNMFVTNGPLLEVRIGNTVMGGNTRVTGDSVTARVKLSAATWVPVDQLRAVVDGETHVLDIPLDAESLVRFEGDVELALPSDRNAHWVIFEAGASLDALQQNSGDAGTFSRIYPGHLPLAFTNPIFIAN